jgi:hypothetical protein
VSNAARCALTIPMLPDALKVSPRKQKTRSTKAERVASL